VVCTRRASQLICLRAFVAIDWLGFIRRGQLQPSENNAVRQGSNEKSWPFRLRCRGWIVVTIG
jgi:hypothetical protein